MSRRVPSNVLPRTSTDQATEQNLREILRRARPTPTAAITDVPTAGSATAADNATAINQILAALRAAEIIEE